MAACSARGAALALALVGCGSEAPVASPAPDPFFTAAEWRRIRRLSPVPAAPRSPTNRYADNPRAALLGRALFEDTGFSRDGRVACATCHQPGRAFADGRPVAVGRDRGTRNTPSLHFVAFGRWKLWDGAADSLWSQPLLALENPREHATTRLAVAHRVATAYRARYEEVFGPLPPLDDRARFPDEARPGDAAWEAMRADDREAVNRVAANFGKAIEAYERTLTAAAAPFDRYVAGAVDAISPQARDGLALFLRVGCVGCHDGPLLSDQDFHNLRVPDDPMAGGDPGRLAGIAVALASPLNAAGAFSDDRAAWPLTGYAPHPSQRGQFRTPSLRGVALTAPYGHAGALATLADVVRHDARGGLAADDPRAVGDADPGLIPFDVSDAQVAALVAFLESLTPDAR